MTILGQRDQTAPFWGEKPPIFVFMLLLSFLGSERGDLGAERGDFGAKNEDFGGKMYVFVKEWGGRGKKMVILG